jgi:hypothetical protein
MALSIRDGTAPERVPAGVEIVAVELACGLERFVGSLRGCPPERS